MTQAPYSLLAELEAVAGQGNPPVEQWHPEVSRDIDIRVRRDGVWTYMGSAIERPRLVRLFASILRREDSGDYFLVTPVEKCRITVEDVPFKVILMDVQGEGDAQRLTVTTNMAEQFAVDADHRLRVAVEGDEWIPYVHARAGMEARFERSVYYQLADLVAEGPNGAMGVWSCSEFFALLEQS